MTGFVPGQLGLGVAVGSPLTQLLTETTTITLEDEEMFNAFIEGLKNVKSIFNNVNYAQNSRNYGKNKNNQTKSNNIKKNKSIQLSGF